MQQWRHVFLIAAAVLVLTNLVYVCTASGEIQPWNDPPSSSEEGDAEAGKSSKWPWSRKERLHTVTRVMDDFNVYDPQVGFRKTKKDTYQY